MARGGRVALLLLALAAGAAAWRLLGGSTEDVVPGGTGGRRPVEAERPDALSLTGVAAPAKPPDTQVPPSDPTAPDGCIVECTFVWPAGVQPGPGEAALVRQDGRFLVSAKTDPTGVVRLELAGASLPEEGDWLEVVGIVPGRLVEAGTLVQARRGARVRCPLRVHSDADEVRLTGQVVDARGAPVAGLVLALRTSDPERHGRLERYDVRESAEAAMSGAATRWIEARVSAIVTTTDGSGAFQFHASSQGLDRHPWALSQHARLEPKVPGERWSTDRVRLFVAHPTFRLGVSVTSEPMPAWEYTALAWTIRVDGKQVSTTTMDGTTPFVVADWMPPETGTIEIEVTAEAHGYARAARRWTLSREDLAPRLDLTLRPLRPEELGTVLVEGPPPPAMGSTPPVTLRRAIEMGAPNGMHVQVLPHDPTRPDRFLLPAGRTRLLAMPAADLGYLFTASGEMEVVGGQETVWRPPWPPHGSLKVEARSNSAGRKIRTLHLQQRSGEEQSASHTFDDAETLLRYLPTGAYRVRSEGLDWVEFEIHAGQVTSLVLGR